MEHIILNSQLKLFVINVTSWNKIYTSSVPEADFTFDEPNDCHIDVEYQFINTSIGENNFFDEFVHLQISIGNFQVMKVLIG